MNSIKKMHTKILFLFMALPALLWSQGDNNRLVAQFDSLVNKAYEKGLFSGNLLVANRQGIVYQTSVGYEDIAAQKKNNANTAFQIGSISKMFTKIIILQLAAENKLHLSDKLGKYLQGFPKAMAASISIQQLMDHTSGLGDYTQEEGFMQRMPAIESVSDILPLIQQSELLYAPGSGKKYSNSGYVLLAAIAEKISGKKFGTIVKERIFDVIGMRESGFNTFVTKQPGKAVGYVSNQPGPLRDNFFIHIIGAGDGGIYASTGDLLKFMESFVNDQKLLSDADKLLLLNTPLFPVSYTSWDDFLQRGRMALSGGAPGISAVISFNMEMKTYQIVLSNFDEGSAESINQRLNMIWANKTPTPFRLPPSRFIYSLIKEKGGDYFSANYQKELAEAGIEMDDDMIFLFAGEQLLQEKNADAAIALFQVYTKEFPNIIVAWNDLGDAYRLINNKDAARNCYLKVLQMRPANERAKRALEKL
ncbi:MAG: hypothetical protein RLZZ28_781 [Bacteroidota bacterium]